MPNESLGVQRHVGSRHFKCWAKPRLFLENPISVLLNIQRHLRR